MSLKGGIPSLQGLDRAIAVIVLSEIGDKTFLIAAILSMRYPRMTVFLGSLSALALMSLLSSLLGTLLPSLLPRRYTTAAAAILFFVFGAKMLQEGLEMEGGEAGREKLQSEFKEVEAELDEALPEGGGIAMADMEEGRRGLTSKGASVPSEVPPPALPSVRRIEGLKDGFKNLCSLFLSPVFVQAFILTFLAEWGDRSQITTIALAAAHNVWLITFGTTLGHSLCTAMAVIGGRWISQRISIKHVTLAGAVLFLIFGLVYVYEAWTWDESITPEI